jgi:glycosyltransferase involved in cell wall biosynthesis
MRIAIINFSRRKVGGVEVYLDKVIAELDRIGHKISFWHEIDEPTDRDNIGLPQGAPAWCVSHLGSEPALAALRDWKPDLIYAHSLITPELEAETLKIAPAVFFIENYYGTCISGAKTFKFPTAIPCSRRFGWQCLFHYFPRRCGGRSPLTMLKEYRRQSKRLELLHSYAAIITTDHMRSEFLNHGLKPVPAFKFSGALESVAIDDRAVKKLNKDYLQLLFLGRMDLLKGGRIFIDSLPKVRAELGKPLRVIFGGDGLERAAWQSRAAKVQAANRGLNIEFPGWLNSSQMETLWDESDLLVVPSLWPEPFATVGREAGMHGVPVAAFAVGGNPDWLTDGVNGHLAPGDPPTAAGLADAIVKCLRDPVAYGLLQRGARELIQRFTMQNHLSALLEVFEEVLRNRGKGRG